MTEDDNVSLRTAMIVGYHSEHSRGTLAQELAHAMGRLHAPCGGPAALDRKYPYSDASIGVWGWDVLEKTFIDPSDRVDFMSYCNPVWVSDYTFAGLYDRMIEVELAKRPGVGEATRRLKTYHVAKDGSLRPGPTIQGVPSTADELVLENAAHQWLGRVRGSFRPLSNIGGGILVTPTEIPAATLKGARFARAVVR
ncbi:MAG: hypothetical protein K0S65_988 [Labilithrix sp.]|nr:hypothetical protein [Labilithrix sp.]